MPRNRSINIWLLRLGTLFTLLGLAILTIHNYNTETTDLRSSKILPKSIVSTNQDIMGDIGQQPPHPTLRIAVLECDTPIGRTKEKYGGYGGLFKELLEAGATQYSQKDGKPRPELDVRKYDVVNHEVYPNIEDVDVVLLTGSKHNSFDNDPWILKLVDFTRKVLDQRRVRLIGVCFGHQVIGRAMDVKVDRSDKGWEVSVCAVQLTPKGKELFGVEELAIHQMHHDIVYSYPPGTTELGHSPSCEVQGFYIEKRVITVQGHPEFNGDIVSELLDARHATGVFDDQMWKDGMERVRKHHDGVAIGAAFIRFALE